jgi:hypothetical protein
VARFTCSTTILDSRLFWFVNRKPVNALPLEYQAISTRQRGLQSTLQLLSQGITNNSEILCAIDPSHRISIFSDPVFLTGRDIIRCMTYVMWISYSYINSLLTSVYL